MIAQLAALTRITFTELVRQKIFCVILVFCAPRRWQLGIPGPADVQEDSDA
jgi:hypothetical protein